MKEQIRILLSTLMVWALILPLAGQAQKIVKEPRPCTPFTRIVNHSSADIVLLQGTQNEVVVEADESIINHLITESKGNTLTISLQPHRPFRRIKTLKVLVTVATLEELMINGSGDVSAPKPLQTGNLTLKINGSGDARIEMEGGSLACFNNGSGDVTVKGVRGDLQLDIHGSGDFSGTNMQLNHATLSCFGSGDIRLEGKAAQLNIESSASGDINTTALPAEKVVVQARGSGDVKVWAVQSCQASLLGSGDVVVKGNPKNRQVSKKGSGDIHFL